nr:MAG TPA: hypothetical protein [Caudoviricetes sp.]
MCLIIRELFSSSRLCPRYRCRRISSIDRYL